MKPKYGKLYKRLQAKFDQATRNCDHCVRTNNWRKYRYWQRVANTILCKPLTKQEIQEENEIAKQLENVF